MANLKMLLHLSIFIAMLSTLVKSDGLMPNDPRKLDETTPPDLENKCGGCPCNNPCNPPPTPPPPPPPTPCPPPPAPKKPPPTSNCPPPPTSNCQCPPPPCGGCPPPPCGECSQYQPNPPYIFINGPPGNLYPVDAYYSASSRSVSTGLFQFLIVSCLGMLIILW